jgi:hypothetical protein
VADAPTRPPTSYEEQRLSALCPVASGWRAVVLTRAGTGPWRIEEDPLLALAVARSVQVAFGNHPYHERDTEIDRPDYRLVALSVGALDAATNGVVGVAVDELYAPHVPYAADYHWTQDPDLRYVEILLGYIGPGDRVRDGDSWVLAAERFVAEYARQEARCLVRGGVRGT